MGMKADSPEFVEFVLSRMIGEVSPSASVRVESSGDKDGFSIEISVPQGKPKKHSLNKKAWLDICRRGTECRALLRKILGRSG